MREDLWIDITICELCSLGPVSQFRRPRPANTLPNPTAPAQITPNLLNPCNHSPPYSASIPKGFHRVPSWTKGVLRVSSRPFADKPGVALTYPNTDKRQRSL